MPLVIKNGIYTNPIRRKKQKNRLSHLIKVIRLLLVTFILYSLR